MKRNLIKRLVFVLTMFTSFVNAQTPVDISGGAESIWDDISDAAPFVFASIFVVAVAVNLGKLFGEGRDYAAFFRGIFLWVGVLTVIGAVVTGILALTF